jgi:outer membrane protein OmpA-like peptidoglycan-associated protein
MLKSMTGYGKATGTYNTKKISIEVRSLNSKSLDLNVRVAPIYKELESELRKVIGHELDRGKVDLTVKSGVAPYIFEWSTGMKTEDIAQLKKGTYEVTVTDSIGQKVNAKVSLVEPQPETKKVIRLPEVRYAINSWEFVNDETINSFDSLNLVAQLLNEYPTMRLELMSHTDARGNEKANLLLSQNRAKAVFTYLVREKGIDGRRLIPVGKGETEPAKYMDIKSGKEILLTETYINSFKISNPKEFERLHQINRRMEGKILGLDFDTSSSLLVNPAYFIKIK